MTADAEEIPRPDDDVLCYHEAGHAVMSVLVGRKVLFVDVDSGEDHEGTPHHGLTSSPPLKAHRVTGTKKEGHYLRDVLLEAQIALAGPVANALCASVPLKIDLRDPDYGKAWYAMSGYLQTDQGQEIFETTEPTGDDITDAVYGLAQVVEKMLTEHWEAVNRVVVALSTERSLTGARLHQLVKAGDSPPTTTP